jgi:hypothetical protein
LPGEKVVANKGSELDTAATDAALAAASAANMEDDKKSGARLRHPDFLSK